MSEWDYETEEQKTKMEELITPKNCGEKLRLVREVSGLSRRDLANSLGCSESTISRLETEKTEPTIDITNRLRALVLIGYHRFAKMSDSQKGSLSENISSLGGAAAGIAGAIGTVSAGVAGLSAAGVTSGLSDRRWATLRRDRLAKTLVHWGGRRLASQEQSGRYQLG